MIAAPIIAAVFALLLAAAIVVACASAPKGGWDYTDHHARRNHR